MANPSGANQLSPNGYGDVQAQKSLLRSAPISGAPTTASALNAPQRSQRRASKTRQPAQQQPVPDLPQAPQPTAQAQVGQLWSALAMNPDSSDLVKYYADKAQGQPQ